MSERMTAEAKRAFIKQWICDGDDSEIEEYLTGDLVKIWDDIEHLRASQTPPNAQAEIDMRLAFADYAYDLSLEEITRDNKVLQEDTAHHASGQTRASTSGNTSEGGIGVGSASLPPVAPPHAVTREQIAKTLYDQHNRGCSNVWKWEDSGLDDEHPGKRERHYGQADAILALLAEKPAYTPTPLDAADFAAMDAASPTAPTPTEEALGSIYDER
jgi:hypothetical protein